MGSFYGYIGKRRGIPICCWGAKKKGGGPLQAGTLAQNKLAKKAQQLKILAAGAN